MKMTQKELDEILELHKKWIHGDAGGECIDLPNVDLSGADLRHAELEYANLQNANLSKANLTDANLSNADLSHADFTDACLDNTYFVDTILIGAKFTQANLTDANLRRANLIDADFTGACLSHAKFTTASLYRANLTNADLYLADLSYADLRHADLTNVDLTRVNLKNTNLAGAKTISNIPMTCPEVGAFVGWKKTNGFIIKLQIPADAKRSSATGRKCRCEYAKVLAIENLDGTPSGMKSVINTNYCPNIIYAVGETVHPDSFDTDRFNECSHGIHFFISRQEAVDY